LKSFECRLRTAWPKLCSGPKAGQKHHRKAAVLLVGQVRKQGSSRPYRSREKTASVTLTDPEDYKAAPEPRRSKFFGATREADGDLIAATAVDSDLRHKKARHATACGHRRAGLNRPKRGTCLQSILADATITILSPDARRAASGLRRDRKRDVLAKRRKSCSCWKERKGVNDCRAYSELKRAAWRGLRQLAGRDRPGDQTPGEPAPASFRIPEGSRGGRKGKLTSIRESLSLPPRFRDVTHGVLS